MLSEFQAMVSKMRLTFLSQEGPVFSPSLMAFLKLVLCGLLFCLFYRGIFISLFLEIRDAQEWGPLLESLILGFRFDLRLSLLLSFVFILLQPITFLRLSHPWAESFWPRFYTLVFFIFAMISSFDMASFSYSQKRLSMNEVRFVMDAREAILVGLEGFPVGWYFLFTLLTTVTAFYTLRKWVFGTPSSALSTQGGWVKKGGPYTAIILMALWALYGKIPPAPPLRWAEIYKIKNSFWSSQSLNPVLYLYASRFWSSGTYQEKDVKEFYPHAQKILGIPPQNKELDFSRTIKATPLDQLHPGMNLIVFIMESLASFKTGLENPLNPTPVLKKMAEQGVYFENFYSNTTGTAKGVYGTLTSVPDPFMGRKGTVSRNDRVPKQSSALNALENHQKFYLLGGSLNWAQIRSVIFKALPSAQILDQEDLSTQSHYVWGLSDFHLMMEAHKIFVKQKQPFVAVIQTATYHRPYKFPKGTPGFVPEKRSLEELKKFGFDSLEEYNTLRFVDHSLGYFLELAKKSGYLDNSLIVILADHGLSGSMAHVPEMERQLNLGRFHSPYILYAPSKLRARKVATLGLQTDALPTAVAALGYSFVGRGFGVNLLDPKTARQAVYFQGGDILYELSFDGLGRKRVESYSLSSKEMIQSYWEEEGKLVSSKGSSERAAFFKGLFATFNYLVFHNFAPGVLSNDSHL